MRHDICRRANDGRLEEGVIVWIAATHDLMLDRYDARNVANKIHELLDICLSNPKLIKQNAGDFIDYGSGYDRGKLAIPPRVPNQPGGTIFILREERAAPNGGVENYPQWLRGLLSFDS